MPSRASTAGINTWTASERSAPASSRPSGCPSGRSRRAAHDVISVRTALSRSATASWIAAASTSSCTAACVFSVAMAPDYPPTRAARGPAISPCQPRPVRPRPSAGQPTPSAAPATPAGGRSPCPDSGGSAVPPPPRPPPQTAHKPAALRAACRADFRLRPCVRRYSASHARQFTDVRRRHGAHVSRTDRPPQRTHNPRARRAAAARRCRSRRAAGSSGARPCSARRARTCAAIRSAHLRQSCEVPSDPRGIPQTRQATSRRRSRRAFSPSRIAARRSGTTARTARSASRFRRRSRERASASARLRTTDGGGDSRIALFIRSAHGRQRHEVPSTPRARPQSRHSPASTRARRNSRLRVLSCGITAIVSRPALPAAAPDLPAGGALPRNDVDDSRALRAAGRSPGAGLHRVVRPDTHLAGVDVRITALPLVPATIDGNRADLIVVPGPDRNSFSFQGLNISVFVKTARSPYPSPM